MLTPSAGKLFSSPREVHDYPVKIHPPAVEKENKCHAAFDHSQLGVRGSVEAFCFIPAPPLRSQRTLRCIYPAPHRTAAAQGFMVSTSVVLYPGREGLLSAGWCSPTRLISTETGRSSLAPRQPYTGGDAPESVGHGAFSPAAGGGIYAWGGSGLARLGSAVQ